jgi:hypothetical protein
MSKNSEVTFELMGRERVLYSLQSIWPCCCGHRTAGPAGFPGPAPGTPAESMQAARAAKRPSRSREKREACWWSWGTCGRRSLLDLLCAKKVESRDVRSA